MDSGMHLCDTQDSSYVGATQDFLLWLLFVGIVAVKDINADECLSQTVTWILCFELLWGLRGFCLSSFKDDCHTIGQKITSSPFNNILNRMFCKTILIMSQKSIFYLSSFWLRLTVVKFSHCFQVLTWKCKMSGSWSQKSENIFNKSSISRSQMQSFWWEIMKKFKDGIICSAEFINCVGFPHKSIQFCVSDGSLMLLSVIWLAMLWQGECLSPPYEFYSYQSLKSGTHLIHFHFKILHFINFKQFKILNEKIVKHFVKVFCNSVMS